MTNILTLLNYTFALRSGNLAGAQKAADKLGFAPTTADLENINNIYNEKICHYCKFVADYTTNRTKEFAKVANSTSKKIETKIKNIIKSDELKEIATHIKLSSITLDQLSIIRTLKKEYTNIQLQEVFPLAQAIQNYAEKFSTENIQKEIFTNYFPNKKEKLQELLEFYQAVEKITEDIKDATDIIKAALKNKVWEKDFYRVKEVVENGTKTIINQTVFVATQNFFTEAEKLKTRIKKYSLDLRELASKKYYELVKRLDVYESYISSKYPLAELEEFKTSAMLALHEQTKNSQYHRYFTRFAHQIKIQPENIFTENLEEARNKIKNTIDQYLQVGNAEYKKLSSAIIKNKKLIADIQTQKKVLAEKIKLIQYDLYGNFSEDANLHSVSASLGLTSIKRNLTNILYLTKPFAENFREIDGEIKSRTNKIAYFAETLQILYQKTKLSFLSSVLLDSKKEETFLQKINLLISNFINSNNLVSAQYSISQSFSFKNLNEVLEIQADPETEKNRQNFLYRIFYALPEQKEHIEFIRQNILQNKKMPVELKDLVEQQYKNAFGFDTTEPKKLQNKIKEIQKRYGLLEDGILGNNICYLKKDVGEFFGKQIKNLDIKNYSIANLINKPLPEGYIYFFKKSLNFLAVIKQQPRWKFPQVNSYYADIEGKPGTTTTTGIIKHFQNYVQVAQTGVIDKDTLQTLTALLSTGLKNSTEDVKNKYNELEVIAKNAKSRIEYLQMQKQGIVKQLERLETKIKTEKNKIKEKIISNKADGSALYRSNKFNLNDSKNFIENGKTVNDKLYNTLEKHIGEFFYKEYDREKNLFIEKIKKTEKKLSEIEFKFENNKFKSQAEKLNLKESDGSILDNVRFDFQNFWHISQKIETNQNFLENLEEQKKELQNIQNKINNDTTRVHPFLFNIKSEYRLWFKDKLNSYILFFYIEGQKIYYLRLIEINYDFRGEGYNGVRFTRDGLYCWAHYNGHSFTVSWDNLIASSNNINKATELKNNFLKKFDLEDFIAKNSSAKSYVKNELFRLKRLKLQIEPVFYRSLQTAKRQIQKIMQLEATANFYKTSKTQIQTNLDNIDAQIQQQTNLLLNKTKINESMLSVEKIAEQINFKTSELENAQLNFGRLVLALTNLNAQQKTLEDSYNRIKNSFTKRILTSSDPVNNALALASYVPAIAEKVLPNQIVEELKSQGDAVLTQAKNFFTSVAQKADTIAKAGANAIMDFKNAIIGMDTRIQDWKHKLELWFNSEKRKVEQYAKELRAELSTPKAIEKIRAEMQRDNTNAIAQTLIEIDAISPVPKAKI